MTVTKREMVKESQAIFISDTRMFFSFLSDEQKIQFRLKRQKTEDKAISNTEKNESKLRCTSDKKLQ